jgi:TolA-binding protein
MADEVGPELVGMDRIMQQLNDMKKEIGELQANQVQMKDKIRQLSEENAELRRGMSPPEVDWSHGRNQSMAGGEVPEDGVLAVCVSGQQVFSIEEQSLVRAWTGSGQVNYNDIVVPVSKGQRWKGTCGQNQGLVFYPYRRRP